jgi:hypothetical protein
MVTRFTPVVIVLFLSMIGVSQGTDCGDGNCVHNIAHRSYYEFGYGVKSYENSTRGLIRAFRIPRT